MIPWTDEKIMKSETQRLTHEQGHMTDKIKDNTDKIENNRQLPYLVGNVIEILDMNTADGAEEEGIPPNPLNGIDTKVPTWI